MSNVEHITITSKPAMTNKKRDVFDVLEIRIDGPELLSSASYHLD